MLSVVVTIQLYVSLTLIKEALNFKPNTNIQMVIKDS